MATVQPVAAVGVHRDFGIGPSILGLHFAERKKAEVWWTCSSFCLSGRYTVGRGENHRGGGLAALPPPRAVFGQGLDTTAAVCELGTELCLFWEMR